MIDEFPILAVAATQAQGETVVRDAAELRVKETDRIATTVQELQRLDADIEPRPDGMVVRGPTPLIGRNGRQPWGSPVGHGPDHRRSRRQGEDNRAGHGLHRRLVPRVP